MGDEGLPSQLQSASILQNASKPWPALKPVYNLTPPCLTAPFPAAVAQAYSIVASTGKPNYLEARIPHQHGLNMKAWRHYAAKTNLPDKTLCDFLEYGFPSGYCKDTPPVSTHKNHSSALQYKDHVSKYLSDEVSHGAMLGPYSSLPFAPWCQVNPMLSNEKTTSSGKRRTVIDLSFPENDSVNDGILKDSFLGYEYALRLPQSKTLVSMILRCGPGAYLYGTDVKRAYRQLRLDFLELPLFTVQWEGLYYTDVAPAFGLRTSAVYCQRTTEAVCHFLAAEDQPVVPFIDDFAGATISDYRVATRAASRLSTILSELGVEEAVSKASPPSTKMIWCGLMYDTVAMTVSIPDAKLQDIKLLVIKWINIELFSRRNLQSIVGKLVHVAQCSPPASLYIQPLLSDLRGFPATGKHPISDHAKQDLCWFKDHLPDFNGLHMFDSSPLPSDLQVNIIYQSGFMSASTRDTYFKQQSPGSFTDLLSEITTILIAIHLWADKWSGHTVNLFLTDKASCVINSGRAKDPAVNHITRLIWSLALKKDFFISAHPHISPPAKKVCGKKCTISKDIWKKCVLYASKLAANSAWQ